jgi:hypothetical protein
MLLPFGQASHKLPISITKTKTHKSDPELATNVASTLHFVQLTPGFSH